MEDVQPMAETYMCSYALTTIRSLQRKSSSKMQNMTCVMVLTCVCLRHLDGVFGDEVKSVSVMEGHSVTLHTDTQLQSRDVVEWMFGVQSPDEIIAEFYREANMTSFNNERLKNHLQIDDQTGSLIITNITTQHTGLYQAEITRYTQLLSFYYNVTVSARPPVPAMTGDSSQNSSNSLSSSNHTQHLNITDVCQPCPVCVECCGFTEAVIRLVISALVCVATVAVLIYDIRSNRAHVSNSIPGGLQLCTV
ncbi:uncharacterized protein LOC130429834 [Triplophysa dalaica]|uniref:uncharacterized protein LOC130429834 n=1 Tax=Triplophysa dalaica TaxID=1582913 RepID=UPI0024E02722|nr:uncharacterized protein LOC130429834 [Triplophysa dalaica]